MLRRLDLSNATQRLAAVVAEVLDAAAARGTINLAQRVALGADMAQRLGAPHPV
jgi:diacylglycerol kinase (ATP)